MAGGLQGVTGESRRVTRRVKYDNRRDKDTRGKCTRKREEEEEVVVVVVGGEARRTKRGMHREGGERGDEE